MPPNRRSRLRLGLILLAGSVLFLGVTAYSLRSPDRADTASPSGAGNEQMREELRALGVLRDQDIDCVVAGLREVGVTDEDSRALARGETPEGLDRSSFVEFNASLRACLDDDTLRRFTERSIATSPPSTVRHGFITALMAVSPVVRTREQGGCVYDSLVASGIDFADALIDPEDAGVTSAIDDALLMCGLT